MLEFPTGAIGLNFRSINNMRILCMHAANVLKSHVLAQSGAIKRAKKNSDYCSISFNFAKLYVVDSHEKDIMKIVLMTTNKLRFNDMNCCWFD